MSTRIAQGLFGLLLTTIAAGVAARPTMPDATFLDESHQAMDRMMAGMAVAPSGDADRDFATMMIPHHQGAIDMAVAELKFGRDPRLRRIAQEIIVDQQQEIVVMRDAIDGKAGQRPAPAPSSSTLSPSKMSMPMPGGRMMK